MGKEVYRYYSRPFRTGTRHIKSDKPVEYNKYRHRAPRRPNPAIGREVEGDMYGLLGREQTFSVPRILIYQSEQ